MRNGKPIMNYQELSDEIIRKRQSPISQIMAEFNAAFDASHHLFDTEKERIEFQINLMLKTVERIAVVDEENNPGSVERRAADAKRFGFDVQGQ